ncbi:MAG: hypothetical protein AB8G15_10845 [Saprospiraceae bacterium]
MEKQNLYTTINKGTLMLDTYYLTAVLEETLKRCALCPVAAKIHLFLISNSIFAKK